MSGPAQLPILPSSGFDATIGFYALLGFDVDGRFGDEYLTLSHPAGIELHFYGAGRVKTRRNDHAVYLRFTTAAESDALHADWAAVAASPGFADVAGAAGRITEPADTDYGLREWALLDHDGNLLRVGGGITPPDPGPVLVLIDVQKGFDDPSYPPRNNPGAEERMGELLERWRRSGDPVIHVIHDSTEERSVLKLHLPGGAIADEVEPRPGEPVVVKHTNSCFVGTPVERMLREMGATTVVMAGLTTDHCVSTSVRAAANLGFEVTVVSDATATHDTIGVDGRTIPAAEVHAVALASLSGEFADVRSAQELLVEG